MVFALLVAAFAAGWFARDPPRRHVEEDDVAPAEPTVVEMPAEAPATAEPLFPHEPLPDAAALLDDAIDAYERALDTWMAEQNGAASVAAFERAVAMLHAGSGPAPPAGLADALGALEEAVRLLAPAKAGTPIDAATSKALEPLEDRFERAWRELG